MPAARVVALQGGAVVEALRTFAPSPGPSIARQDDAPTLPISWPGPKVFDHEWHEAHEGACHGSVFVIFVPLVVALKMSVLGSEQGVVAKGGGVDHKVGKGRLLVALAADDLEHLVESDAGEDEQVAILDRFGKEPGGGFVREIGQPSGGIDSVHARSPSRSK